ncbi:MAG: YetF domain-containing protein [Alloalcanivorax venustensis]|jgi:uncharacterized membrane protein YcaP (DUF421 family)|uniref:DUF421 domain-containing protein n=1 Tax=Alloalcanivorax venustensis TaxID=172371 RepID=UPI000C95BA10|nr:hypothetical protein [Alcanivorax sp.]MCH9784495.1 DUF421 domain-containing protein [Gammaproteobacteria bacterium]HAI35549.1 DUF421 domain-containing protein [Alcanivorax sp.]HAI90588.1 DUF421 domain-containing protein [Alcanivorax sp.]HBP69526.1 DUF421 domain-containing protein [Alcanivorax sp.]|tara:strand:- start:169 stop:681 length:513 start_codon:yes stop_codon:yes gene_type:complete
MEAIFFNGWSVLGRTLLIGVLAYVSLVFMLRVSGKRTLAKMNAFDLVVTVAIGSTLATIVLSKSVALAEGLLALALLIGMQFAISWSSTRMPWLRRVVTGEPRLLLRDGTMLDEALRDARVTREEVRAAVRSSGIGALGDVAAVVLETDGSFSVIAGQPGAALSSLDGVK